MSTAEKLLTAEEFAALPEPEGGGQMELVRGRVVVAPPPYTGHGRRSYRIGRRLDAFVEPHQLGVVIVEGGYLLARDPDIVRAPDAAFLAADRVPAGGVPDTEYIRGAPTLAVEVVSPNDRDVDVAEKVAEYLAAGGERVWVVRPQQRTVTVHRPNGDAHTYGAVDTLTSDDAGFAVPGFSVTVAELFS
jgi:Uma2 family endonuclease